MALTLPITLAVLFGALLHASWNAMVRRGGDRLLDLALVALGASVLAAPLLPFVVPPARASWPFLAASSLIHVGYYATLAGTYRHAELSIGYPLMRGSAPLLVTLAGLAWFGERPTPATALGIALICLGVASLAFAGRQRAPIAPALRFAWANAAMIAAYTLVDAAGARAAGSVLGYVLWMFFLEGLPFAAIVVARRGAASVAGALRSRWRVALGGGGCSALSYGIAVWAMTEAPVGAVAALRETSVVFALGIGALLLKERPAPRALAGVAAVLAGAVVLRG
ncbi:MAG TPA: EamA family transporter [Ideonella sp.]|nr:EamA family transporter [Ideonella sp.]